MSYNPTPVLEPAYALGSPDTLTSDAADNELILPIPGRGRPTRRARAFVKTPPAGGSITVDIIVFTMATGAVARTLGTVTILDGTYTGTTTWAPDTILETEAIGITITSVPATPGENLSVEID